MRRTSAGGTPRKVASKREPEWGEKEFQPALQQLLAAAQSAPNDPRVYVYLADTYRWLGMDAESNQAAERAKQLDPARSRSCADPMARFYVLESQVATK